MNESNGKFFPSYPKQGGSPLLEMYTMLEFKVVNIGVVIREKKLAAIFSVDELHGMRLEDMGEYMVCNLQKMCLRKSGNEINGRLRVKLGSDDTTWGPENKNTAV